jgi:hypothetical protein
MSCKQTHRPEKEGAAPPPPVHLERGKLVEVVVAPRRTLSKQSLRGQVSAKLTPEICTNKASSNRRLTAAGRGATASDSHSQNSLQTLCFFLHTFDKTTTKPHLHAEKLTETVLHLNLGHFVVFLGFFVCLFVLFYLVYFPFDEKTTELLLRHYLQDWRLRD